MQHGRQKDEKNVCDYIMPEKDGQFEDSATAGYVTPRVHL